MSASPITDMGHVREIGQRTTIKDPGNPFDGMHGVVVGVEYVVRFDLHDKGDVQQRFAAHKVGEWTPPCPECSRPIIGRGVWDNKETGSTLCSQTCAILYLHKRRDEAIASFMDYMKRLVAVQANWTGKKFHVDLAHPQSGPFEVEQHQALVDAGFTWSLKNNTLTVEKSLE
jgi:hypothetical protein